MLHQKCDGLVVDVPNQVSNAKKIKLKKLLLKKRED